MPKQYKRKRMLEDMSRDKTKSVKLEGSERMRAKKEIKQGLKDADDFNDIQLRAEIQWEEEMRMANECYLKELADPENYRCTCYKHKDEDER